MSKLKSPRIDNNKQTKHIIPGKELIYNSDTNELLMGDGVTTGGISLATTKSLNKKSNKPHYATFSPTTNHNKNNGHNVSDKWFNTLTKQEYVLVESTHTNADWQICSSYKIEMSNDTTWFVSPVGTRTASGLTVEEPITLEEAANRVFRIHPTQNDYTLTLVITSGEYSGESSYVFNCPNTQYPFELYIYGEEWVGINNYPTVTTNNTTLQFNNFKNRVRIENIQFMNLVADESNITINNTATSGYCLLTNSTTVLSVQGLYKFSNVANNAFIVSNGTLVFAGTTFDSGDTDRNFIDSFVRLDNSSCLSVTTNPIIVGNFTGVKLKITSPDVLYQAETLEVVNSLPGNISTQTVLNKDYIAAAATNTIDITGTTVITVTIADGEFRFNGNELTDGLLLLPGRTYIFDQSDASNATHELRFSITQDGTHNAGVEYSTGVTVTGTPGTDGILTFVPPINAPETLYPYCTTHALMGGSSVFNTKGGGTYTGADITLDTTNFNLNLSGVDTTVQAALETLDDLVAGSTTAAGITVDTTNFNLNLSGTDTTVQAALETLDDLIAGAGGHTIQDEGTPLTARTNLNFVGDAVTVTDNAGSDTTVVTINTSGTGLNWLGAWSNATSYVIDDGVEYQGSSYIATAPNLNKIPGTDPEWDLLASKGDTGSAGADGAGIVGNILTLPHTATPSDPGAGNTAIYAKDNGKVYKLAAGGIEEEIGASGVGEPPAPSPRIVLTQDTSVYVVSDLTYAEAAQTGGDDTLGDGTVSNPWLTIERLSNYISTVDLNGFTLTCNLNGSFGTEGQAFTWKIPIGSGGLIIQDSSNNKNNTKLKGNFRFQAAIVQVTFKDITFQESISNGGAVNVERGSYVVLDSCRVRSGYYALWASYGGIVQVKNQLIFRNYRQAPGATTLNSLFYGQWQGLFILNGATILTAVDDSDTAGAVSFSSSMFYLETLSQATMGGATFTGTGYSANTTYFLKSQRLANWSYA